MKAIASTVLVLAVGVATLAVAQNQAVPEPQQHPPTQSDTTPPPPSRSDPSMTTMQQPISGNSSASTEKNSMAPNSTGAGERLAGLVPSGMTTREACAKFKTTNDCAAALHAAHDLNLSFVELRDKMGSGEKLGPAIHSLKPDADSKAAARKAEQEARLDLKSQG